MSHPGLGPGTPASRVLRPWHGWRVASARLASLLALLAGVFAGAAQAQERYDNLDHAVNSMIREIVEDGELRGQSVFVGAADFFEEASEFDVRPRLSEMLRAKCRTALTRNGVGNLGMVESEEAWVLHGRWWRETSESREHLHLRLFIARPVEGDAPPQEHEGEAGLMPIDGFIENALKPTLRHWGNSVVRQLERDLAGTGSRKYRLHIPDFEVEGAEQPRRLSRHLRNRWRQAFTRSRRFQLTGPAGFDGKLVGIVLVTDERVEVDLYVQDPEGQEVAAAFVAPDTGLFPSGILLPDVVGRELARCAGLVDERRLEDAKACYKGARDAAPGDARVAAQVPSGLDRIAGIEKAQDEAKAVRGVEDAIGRGDLGEARRRLEGLRKLDAAHPRLAELEGKLDRAERKERKRSDDKAFASAKEEGTVEAFDEYLESCGECGHEEKAQRLKAGAPRRVPPPGTKFRDCDECPELVVVPSGSFMMGSPSREKGRDNSEGPRREVRIAEPFAVGLYEVTFGEWEACVSGRGCSGYRPDDRGWGRGRRPVINVSWEDAQAYVRWLSGKTGKEYRLLSEAEWEYVARAGTTGPFHTGSTISTEQANYNGNHVYGPGRKGRYRKKTTPVGEFPANGFGLHDVHGNVREWVEDCWNDSYDRAPDDGSVWESGNCSRRVLRGGSWGLEPRVLRSAHRPSGTPPASGTSMPGSVLPGRSFHES